MIRDKGERHRRRNIQGIERKRQTGRDRGEETERRDREERQRGRDRRVSHRRRDRGKERRAETEGKI
jgi:hypothetical protein